VLLESVGGDAAFVAELVDEFALDAARLLAQARAAADAGRTDDAARAMHQLKSTSASLGATLLPQMCEELEAGAGLSQDFVERVAAIEAEVARVTTTLRALCATTP
jgi:HPt (histidine-containing phosphotransfer) domain-containing protein